MLVQGNDTHSVGTAAGSPRFPPLPGPSHCLAEGRATQSVNTGVGKSTCAVWNTMQTTSYTVVSCVTIMKACTV